MAVQLEVDPAYTGYNPTQQNDNGSGTSAKTVADDAAVSEHGRTFHSFKQGAYLLPNDAVEQDRLNLQHNLITMMLDGKLGFAPPVSASPSPTNVLDVATGTGIWALEFAKQHPTSRVVGSDLSLIQPAEGGVTNVRFVQSDAENEDWDFPCLFDYIHLRFLVSCFGNVNTVLERIYKQLAPGGWVEFQDTLCEAVYVDGNRNTEGTAANDFLKAFVGGMKAVGRDPTWIGRLEELLTAHGFVDVHVTLLPNPLGPWPKDEKYKKVGTLSAMNMGMVMDSVVKLVMANGWTDEQAKDLARRMRAELAEGKKHMYIPFCFVHARKPE
ncbi:hypothetical protein PWT90_02288 [Aphanocladium album]|nr:hypothetical protein PWT90_02288 [Aphanocladium album]